MSYSRHQTVFGLCLALFVLAGVSIVSVALLLVERQDIDLLRRNIDTLQQENTALRTRLEDYRDGGLPLRSEAALAPD